MADGEEAVVDGAVVDGAVVDGEMAAGAVEDGEMAAGAVEDGETVDGETEAVGDLQCHRLPIDPTSSFGHLKLSGNLKVSAEVILHADSPRSRGRQVVTTFPARGTIESPATPQLSL
ncbi:hypothetical protein BV898_18127 [Hypsibius exemplaris]|uniref:Uncharacterized protein n=1 Tax=Hypsibius exemplaris TaxID=2072580 RepID=A0A9X6RN63_HYPEX|nr:hypothetical protein BV898_18127 [Hypsibius exemplaris]